MNSDLIRKFERQCWNHQANCVDTEKFAKLIVQECAETVQDFVDHRFPASEYPERLKKYFGVEDRDE